MFLLKTLHYDYTLINIDLANTKIHKKNVKKMAIKVKNLTIIDPSHNSFYNSEKKNIIIKHQKRFIITKFITRLKKLKKKKLKSSIQN